MGILFLDTMKHHSFRLSFTVLLGSLLVSQVATPSTATGQTSENDARLREGLAKYPEADTNKDGVLTMKEARDFLAKRRSEKKSNSTDTQVSESKLRAPDHRDIAYGPHERNVLDLWIAESETPTPLLICIHGGGFKGGSKAKYHRDVSLIQPMLDNGISVAAINYRLTDGGKHPYPIPMHDGARALQFLRYHAKEYNLDKTRIASTGGSAGGCMTLWLGLHEDLADPDNEDPVLRESTRLTAMAPSGAQSSLHLPTLCQWFGVTSLVEHGGGRPLFGIPAEGEIVITPELEELVLDASPITHLTKDDPPVYLTYGANRPVTEKSSAGLWVHHPIMGIKLKEAMDEIGLEAHVQYKGGPKIKGYDNQVDFLLKKLKSVED